MHTIFPVAAPKKLAYLTVAMAVCLVGYDARTDPVDQHGDPLPGGAFTRLSTTRWRLDESALAFAPNGRYAIVAGKSTRLIDAATGNSVRVFPVPSYSVFFTDDNKTVMLAHAKTIRYLDVETGKITREVAVNGTGRVWSADGKRVVCIHQVFQGGNWNYCVWDLAQGVELCRWERQFGPCALSADGALLAVRNIQEIGVFSVADKKPVKVWRSPDPFTGRTPNARVVHFLPDGKTLVAAESKRVLLWDAGLGQLQPKGKLIPSLETARDEAATLTASADGRYLAAGGSQGTIYIWDLNEDRLLHTLADAGKGLPIYTLDFTPDSKRLISQTHLFPSARLWDVASGKELTSTAVASSNIERIVFSRDGKTLATVGRRDPVHLWDTESGKLLRCFEHSDSFAFHPDGKALVTAHGLEAAIWNVQDGMLRQRVKGAPIPKDAPTKDLKQVYWTSHCPGDQSIVGVFLGDVRRVVPSGPGGRDHTTHWTMIGIANTQTGKMERSFRSQADYLSAFCLSADGRMLAAVGSLPDRTANTASVQVWDLQQGVELFHADVPCMAQSCERLLFSPDSRALFVTFLDSNAWKGEHKFQVLEIASGKPRASFAYAVDLTTTMSRGAIGSDRLAAIGSAGTISLFDPLTGKEFRKLQTGQERLGCLAFSPDGKRIACAGNDTTALIWDSADLVSVPVKAQLADDSLARLWTELASENAETACRAIRELIQAPDQTVAYLGKQLQPAPPLADGKIKALVGQLDSESFAERQRAGRELLELPDLAEPALAEALKNMPSLETRRRIEALLSELKEKREKGPWLVSGESLRQWRAIEVLERTGTPEARRLLERLAKGGPHAVLTRQANAAAQRLTQRASQP